MLSLPVKQCINALLLNNKNPTTAFVLGFRLYNEFVTALEINFGEFILCIASH